MINKVLKQEIETRIRKLESEIEEN